MKKLFFLLSCSLFFSVSNAQNDTLKMSDLNVKDGFEYKMIQDIVLDLFFEDLDDAKYIYQIKGIDREGNAGLISQNFLPIDGCLQTSISLPLHINKILIELKNGKKTYSFECPKEAYIEKYFFMGNPHNKVLLH